MSLHGFFTKCSSCFLLKKYTIGMIALTIQASPVAIAAPRIPHLKTATNSASSRILATALEIVVIRPSPGRSAVISSGWKAMDIIWNGIKKASTRP